LKKKLTAVVREIRQVAKTAREKTWFDMKTGGLKRVDFMMLRQY